MTLRLTQDITIHTYNGIQFKICLYFNLFKDKYASNSSDHVLVLVTLSLLFCYYKTAIPAFFPDEKCQQNFVMETMIFSNKFLKPLLFVTSQVFKIFVLLRLLAYKNGWLKTNRVNTPVISVGNLTIGGTGKTPVVDLLAKDLQRFKKNPVILSRGYKRKNKSSQQRSL